MIQVASVGEYSTYYVLHEWFRFFLLLVRVVGFRCYIDRNCKAIYPGKHNNMGTILYYTIYSAMFQ